MMSTCKVGNQTNSQDPLAINSRVFVGNLNTFQCNKTNVERRFQRYGRIAGISMHKGYAFIQFGSPFDARSACLGEDGRLLWGQTLDVNLVSEPKSHQTGRKRQNHNKTGNDWDYYYGSYYAQMAQLGFPPTPRLPPPMKRSRVQPPQSARPHLASSKGNNHRNYMSLNGIKSYGTPDILICGNCRELFSEIDEMIEHKKEYCKLRFTCKCHSLNGWRGGEGGTEEPSILICSQCNHSFHSAWDLMVHVQTAHLLNIYQLGGAKDGVKGHQVNGEGDADAVCNHGETGCNGNVNDRSFSASPLQNGNEDQSGGITITEMETNGEISTQTKDIYPPSSNGSPIEVATQTTSNLNQSQHSTAQNEMVNTNMNGNGRATTPQLTT